MQKNPREKLATLVGVALESGTCNLMEWAARLPIDTQEEASRYAWVERFMNTRTIDEDAVMRGVARGILERAARNGQTIVVCLDQTSIEDRHGILVLSCRLGNRGVALFWRVRETAGNLGFEYQRELLEQLDLVLPEGAKVLLLGDRFFGTAALIRECQKRGFHYRLRLKGNLTLTHEGGELTTGEIKNLGGYGIENATMGDSKVVTHIGYLHEKGHPEPWIIAMDAQPTRKTILDYGLRWSIESMFSDFKSRGFGLEDTHLQRAKRVARLMLVLAIAMAWALCVGMQKQALKKTPEA